MSVASPLPHTEPPHDCPRCPRLVDLRRDLRAEHPDWWNAPVHAFGDERAWLGIIGLAPGKHGANRTGRPFTGDYAGDLLFATLDKFGLSHGTYASRPDDGLALHGAVIVNAVRCLPPQNKPTPREIATCRPFLDRQIEALPDLRVLVALGRIAHDSVLRAFGEKLSDRKFAHGAEHRLSGRIVLVDSYHCSRYNTNTRRLTPEMFEAVFAQALAHRGPS
ncbi:uracil-DNA glycosylase [Stakelama saccharophila]|uniref:Type-5 uracil-DNA glycosylase n=1 Tax=Stakelama saccharophila TaxID=3075605 RepID=A0ABZ0BDE5_9SPHN|nr:uracil-DNA glycosylase [Stakelama sp. W311]WNO55111.1 uracil-DNA glycosylase [Stakelama sp. W311]